MNIKEKLNSAGISTQMTNENIAQEEQQKAIEYLKALNPNIFNGEEINLNALKQALGKPVNNTSTGYGLNFLGKNLVETIANKKSEYEFKFEQEQSKNIDTTENLILRGDNIDSLKLLNNSYKNKIKCIYIDPPYNTDSDDFVYNDSFKENEKNLIEELELEETDIERLGREFKNKKSHNGWLTFMYPRLKLARKLLTDDGVIFISIDDNEQANLKLLCDEIFGEDNFLNNIIWNNKYTLQNDAKYLSGQHDNILLYTKNKVNFNVGKDKRTEEQNKSYKNPDNDVKGAWKPTPIHAKSGGDNSYTITFPNGITWTPPAGRFPRYSRETLINLYNNNELYFNSKNGVDKKTYLSEVSKKGIVFSDMWHYSIAGHTHANNEELAELVGKGIFNNPKGTVLIKRILRLSNLQSNDIILDFFAGSGTTAHAVMQLNAEDNGNRKFILCQLDEKLKYEVIEASKTQVEKNYNKKSKSINVKNKEAISFCEEHKFEPVISSITIERVNRAGDKIKQELIDSGKQEQANNLDIGYKVYSHVKAPIIEVDETNQFSLNLQQATTTHDRLINLMLQTGTQLNQKIEEVQDDCLFKINNNYYIINSEKLEDTNLEQIIKQSNQDDEETNNIYIDGYTATINTTLQQYHKNIKVIL